MLRRGLLVIATAALAACAHTPAVDIGAARAALAPAGVLRVGVNVGSPTSYIVNKEGRETGLTLDLARKIGAELGVPVEVIKYDRIAPVMAGIEAGRIDMTFTNATEDRAKDVNFSP